MLAITSRDKKKFSFLRSLWFRILFILVIIGVVPSYLATAVVVRSYRDRAVSVREMNVKNQCEILRDLLTSERYLEKIDSVAVNSQLTLLSQVYSGRIFVVDSDFRVIKDTYDIDTGRTSVSKDVVNCFTTGKGASTYDDRNAYIIMTFPIEDSLTGGVTGVMLAAVSTNEVEQNARILESRARIVILLVTVLVIVLGIFLSRFLVRPFHRVTKAIEDVTDGYEDEAVSVPDYIETAQITTAFNQMLTRVRSVDNSRQDFVSNVSHELKTPLTSMKVLADSINSMEDVPPELYREFMQDITQEIDRENRIITDLMSMVRLDKKAATLEIERTEIGQLLEIIIKRLRPIAEKRDIQLILDAPEEVFAEVDGSKLSLAFSNLIENAVKYNVDHGWVRIALNEDGKFFFVTVTDCGLGIPQDQQEHIFERFYRGDKSHSTTIEGTGLGLAIARSSIMLHRGAIRVVSKEHEGTTFQVRIPLIRE